MKSECSTPGVAVYEDLHKKQVIMTFVKIVQRLSGYYTFLKACVDGGNNFRFSLLFCKDIN